MKTAEALALAGQSRRPRQTDLRRSVSTVYYALFHLLCRTCGDTLIGSNGADRSKHAWRQAYRAVEHAHAKKQCTNQSVMKRFPKAVEDFANAFVTAQIKRHKADYDPDFRIAKSEVLEDIELAREAMDAFTKCSLKDRRAFTAWIVMKHRS